MLTNPPRHQHASRPVVPAPGSLLAWGAGRRLLATLILLLPLWLAVAWGLSPS